MLQSIQSVRGTYDVLPENTGIWQWLENTIRKVVTSYGYYEIRTPIIEFAWLFERSIGEITDIVEKEMYLFPDRNGDMIALRPEGTAGCVRAGIQHNSFVRQQQKWWYIGPMFRYERPQRGRCRQFYQFGIEIFGIVGVEIEAELILMMLRIWRTLNIEHLVQLHINSIGTSVERSIYAKALVSYLSTYYDQLDVESQRRLKTNPLRILDSKNAQVQAILLQAPKFSEFLTESSRNKYESLCQLLDQFNISYQHNERLIRGLDYYNDIVFEWVIEHASAQNAVCGGGRYDNMVEQLGGPKTPALGLSVGLERLLLLLKKNNFSITNSGVDFYLISSGLKTLAAAVKVAESIRSALPGISAMVDYGQKNFSKQFKQANQLGAKYALVIGEHELENNQIIVKNLQNNVQYGYREQEVVPYKDLIPKLQKMINLNSIKG